MRMKQATTIEEQIKLLKERGVAIEDEAKAKENLLDIGFYRLGFYSFPFEKTFPQLDDRDHLVKKGTGFQDIVSLYYFDYDLRNILLNYLNRIEVNLRTYIVYTVSNYYKSSPTWFADPNVVNKSYVDSFEEKVYKTIRENPVIKRHHKKYINDRFAPAWKTVEFMTLGNICSLYLNLKDRQVQQKIAAHYGCGIGIFINYIETIRIIRNACAHGSCLYNLSLAKAIKSGPAGAVTGNKRHNICGIINVISYIIGKISVNRQRDMLGLLDELLAKDRGSKTNAIIFQCTGFPSKNLEKAE